MNQIKIIENIVTSEEAEFYINYIDNNINEFDSYSDTDNPNRFVWRFGIDDVYEDSNHTLQKLSDIHISLAALFSNVTNAIAKEYGEQQLYVSSFHLGKQLPNSKVDTHIDADPDNNGHFKYSCVVYLNSSVVDGELFFTNLNYRYKPKALSAAVFPAQGVEYEHEVNKISETRYSLPMWITADPDKELKFN